MLIVNKFRLILSLFDAADKKKLMLIGSVSMLNGLLSVVGIASLLPFIGLISQPELMESNQYIGYFKDLTGLESYKGVVIALGACSLATILFGNLVSAFDGFYGEIFGFRKEHVLTKRLLANYLNTDVLEFGKRKTSDRAKELISEVDRVILDTLFAMFELFSGVLVAVCVMGLLLWVDWGVTLVVTGTLVGVHLLIHNFTSTRLEHLGKNFADLESHIYSDVLDALKLQKEIKLNGLSDFFVTRYSKSFRRMVSNRIKHSVIGMVPDYVLEALAYGVIVSVAIYFSVFSDSGTAPITLVGMYAFAAYRLMPAIAGIFGSVENIWFGSAVLDDFVKAFKDEEQSEDTTAVAAPREAIGLADISFRYAADGAFHFEGLHMEFPVDAMTCIKGKTGCGKSTILNLMAGLYLPEKGTVLSDGNPVNAYASKGWKARVGFVPATVNLMQTSLYENIALGVPVDEIDQQKVRAAAEVVDLDAHVAELKEGYDSVYGESGLNFSSGQIQKVGIARALYRDPSLLLLDESTNAFDLKTEELILERLKSIAGMTILCVSHRPSVVQHSDQTIDLEDLLDQL